MGRPPTVSGEPGLHRRCAWPDTGAERWPRSPAHPICVLFVNRLLVRAGRS